MFSCTFYRYDTALECKTKILEMIRALDLPNNPLDEIIDQVMINHWFILTFVFKCRDSFLTSFC